MYAQFQPSLEPASAMSLALAGRFLTTCATWVKEKNTKISFLQSDMVSAVLLSVYKGLQEYELVTSTHSQEI